MKLRKRDLTMSISLGCASDRAMVGMLRHFQFVVSSKGAKGRQMVSGGGGTMFEGPPTESIYQFHRLPSWQCWCECGLYAHWDAHGACAQCECQEYVPRSLVDATNVRLTIEADDDKGVLWALQETEKLIEDRKRDLERAFIDGEQLVAGYVLTVFREQVTEESYNRWLGGWLDCSRAFQPTEGSAHPTSAVDAPHIEHDNDGWHIVIPSISYRSPEGYPEDEAARRLREMCNSLG